MKKDTKTICKKCGEVCELKKHPNYLLLTKHCGRAAKLSDEHLNIMATIIKLRDWSIRCFVNKIYKDDRINLKVHPADYAKAAKMLTFLPYSEI